jgi:transcription elongation factor Elf1
MNELLERVITCPYCGERINILIDCSVHQQNYIEDCQVCCHPINFNVSIDLDSNVNIVVSSEYD